MLASKPRTAVLTLFAAPSNTTQAKTALFRGFLVLQRRLSSLDDFLEPFEPSNLLLEPTAIARSWPTT